jgi:putative ABC transport system substrate-binding protein
MDRRAFLAGSAALLAVPFAAVAQPAGKVYRIGWLAPAPLPTTLDAFREGLRMFGYVEGNNLVSEQRYANGKRERLAGLVAELVAANVDVIVTTGNPATAAAKTMAGVIPVVFVAGNPVEVGLVASLARPGGNMTGLDRAKATLAPSGSDRPAPGPRHRDIVFQTRTRNARCQPACSPAESAAAGRCSSWPLRWPPA